MATDCEEVYTKVRFPNSKHLVHEENDDDSSAIIDRMNTNVDISAVVEDMLSEDELVRSSVSNQQEILNDATSPTSTLVGAFALPSVHNKRHEPYQEDLYEADSDMENDSREYINQEEAFEQDSENVELSDDTYALENFKEIEQDGIDIMVSIPDTELTQEDIAMPDCQRISSKREPFTLREMPHGMTSYQYEDSGMDSTHELEKIKSDTAGAVHTSCDHPLEVQQASQKPNSLSITSNASDDFIMTPKSQRKFQDHKKRSRDGLVIVPFSGISEGSTSDDDGRNAQWTEYINTGNDFIRAPITTYKSFREEAGGLLGSSVDKYGSVQTKSGDDSASSIFSIKLPPRPELYPLFEFCHFLLSFALFLSTVFWFQGTTDYCKDLQPIASTSPILSCAERIPRCDSTQSCQFNESNDRCRCGRSNFMNWPFVMFVIFYVFDFFLQFMIIYHARRHKGKMNPASTSFLILYALEVGMLVCTITNLEFSDPDVTEVWGFMQLFFWLWLSTRFLALLFGFAWRKNDGKLQKEILIAERSLLTEPRGVKI